MTRKKITKVIIEPPTITIEYVLDGKKPGSFITESTHAHQYILNKIDDILQEVFSNDKE